MQKNMIMKKIKSTPPLQLAAILDYFSCKIEMATKYSKQI